MQLDLTRIRDAETPYSRQFDPAELSAADDPFKVSGPVSLVMTIRKDEDLYHLVGQVKGNVELVCSRCLDAFSLPIDAPFDVRYLPQHLNTAGGGDDADEEEDADVVGSDDMSTAFYRDDQIDLSQLVREQIFLTLPMKPLHDDACKGLCPSCGANLNETACSCQDTWDDPRLAPLKALQQKSNQS